MPDTARASQVVARPLLPWSIAAVLLLLAPWVFTTGLGLNVLSQIAIAAIACLSYNLLLGHGGMLGFGHAVFTGTGAYAAIHLLRAAATHGWPVPVSLLPLAGGLAGLAFAALAGLLLTRRAGTTFAMITLGLGELVYAAALMFPQWSGGEAGVSGNRVLGPAVLGVDFGPARQVYHLAAAYAVGSAALLYLYTGTAAGRLLEAVRDNAERVEFLGFSARWIRYRALLVAGFFAGVAGGLAALLFEIVTPEVFSPLRSGSYLLFTFLGGTAWFLGPVLGAVLMVLCTVLLSGWTPAWLLYLGLLFMGAVVLAPQGLAGVLAGMARAWRLHGWRCVLPHGAAACCALLAVGGAVALVEMAYHHQLGNVLGTRFRFLGLLPLDVSEPACWWAVGAWAVAGAGLWHAVRRRGAARGSNSP